MDPISSIPTAQDLSTLENFATTCNEKNRYAVTNAVYSVASKIWSYLPGSGSPPDLATVQSRLKVITKDQIATTLAALIEENAPDKIASFKEGLKVMQHYQGTLGVQESPDYTHLIEYADIALRMLSDERVQHPLKFLTNIEAAKQLMEDDSIIMRIDSEGIRGSLTTLLTDTKHRIEEKISELSLEEYQAIRKDLLFLDDFSEIQDLSNLFIHPKELFEQLKTRLWQLYTPNDPDNLDNPKTLKECKRIGSIYFQLDREFVKNQRILIHSSDHEKRMKAMEGMLSIADNIGRHVTRNINFDSMSNPNQLMLNFLKDTWFLQSAYRKVSLDFLKKYYQQEDLNQLQENMPFFCTLLEEGHILIFHKFVEFLPENQAVSVVVNPPFKSDLEKQSYLFAALCDKNSSLSQAAEKLKISMADAFNLLRPHLMQFRDKGLKDFSELIGNLSEDELKQFFTSFPDLKKGILKTLLIDLKAQGLRKIPYDYRKQLWEETIEENTDALLGLIDANGGIYNPDFINFFKTIKSDGVELEKIDRSFAIVFYRELYNYLLHRVVVYPDSFSSLDVLPSDISLLQEVFSQSDFLSKHTKNKRVLEYFIFGRFKRDNSTEEEQKIHDSLLETVLDSLQKDNEGFWEFAQRVHDEKNNSSVFAKFQVLIEKNLNKELESSKKMSDVWKSTKAFLGFLLKSEAFESYRSRIFAAALIHAETEEFQEPFKKYFQAAFEDTKFLNEALHLVFKNMNSLIPQERIKLFENLNTINVDILKNIAESQITPEISSQLSSISKTIKRMIELEEFEKTISDQPSTAALTAYFQTLDENEMVDTIFIILEGFPNLTDVCIRDKREELRECIEKSGKSIDNLPREMMIRILPLLSPNQIKEVVTQESPEVKEKWLQETISFDEFYGTVPHVLKEIKENNLDNASEEARSAISGPLKEIIAKISPRILAVMAEDDTYAEVLLAYRSLFEPTQSAVIYPCLSEKVFIEFLEKNKLGLHKEFLNSATEKQMMAYCSKDIILSPEIREWETSDYPKLKEEIDRLAKEKQEIDQLTPGKEETDKLVKKYTESFQKLQTKWQSMQRNMKQDIENSKRLIKFMQSKLESSISDETRNILKDFIERNQTRIEKINKAMKEEISEGISRIEPKIEDEVEIPSGIENSVTGGILNKPHYYTPPEKPKQVESSLRLSESTWKSLVGKDGKITHPMTREVFSFSDLVFDEKLHQKVEEFLEKHPNLREEQDD